MGLQPVADIDGLLRRALGIDQDGQIAADAHGIHVVEEDRALGPEQVLHIVLGGRDQNVEAGCFHQAVKLGGVEWNGARAARAGDVPLHDGPPNRRRFGPPVFLPATIRATVGSSQRAAIVRRERGSG